MNHFILFITFYNKCKEAIYIGQDNVVNKFDLHNNVKRNYFVNINKKMYKSQ